MVDAPGEREGKRGGVEDIRLRTKRVYEKAGAGTAVKNLPNTVHMCVGFWRVYDGALEHNLDRPVTKPFGKTIL